jgi:hypothetical protein
MQTKQLLTIEFRYTNKRTDDYKTRTVTIGVYDTFDGAVLDGNKQLELLESKFPLHKFPSGKQANRERFSLNGGCFGSKNTLINNLAYLKAPFDFYFKITELKYLSLEDSLLMVMEDMK